MADSSAIRAGRAFVEVFADNSPLIRGLKDGERILTKWGANVMKAGATATAAGLAIASPFAAAIKLFSDTGSELNDMSARTGASVEGLSELGFAAKQTGAEMGDVEVSLKKMNKLLSEAAGGSLEARQALASLGLKFSDLQGMNPEDQLGLIGQRISNLKTPADRSAAAMKIFGKSGTSLLPMLHDLEALRAEAQRLGLTFSTEDATAADDFGDSMDKLWAIAKRAGSAIGAAVLPSKEMQEGAVDTAASIGKWIRENQGLIRTVATVGAGLIATGISVVALGFGISTLGTILGGMATVATTLGSVLAGAFAIVTSPLALVAVLATGAAAAFVYLSGVGKSTTRFLGERFNDLKSDAIDAFNGIAGALANGNIQLAAEILWTALKLQWAKGTQALQEVWLGFKLLFLTTWNDAVYSLAEAFVNGTASLQTAWQATVDGLSTIWSNFTTNAGQEWNTLLGGLKKDMIHLRGFFDPTVNVKKEVKEVNKQTRGANAELETRRQLEAGERNIKRDKNLKDIESQRAGSVDALRTQNQREKDQLENDTGAALAKNAQELQDLREQFARKVKEGVANALKDRGEDPKLDLPQEQDLKSAGGKDPTGTFNPFAVRGLGTGNVAQRIAIATEETAKQTKKIAAKKGWIIQ